MNKTKMIATIGPSSMSKDIIREMIKEGVDVIRINMSHSTFDEARNVILNVREIDRQLDVVTGIMIDTRGPEIRVNELSDKLDCHILLTDQERQKASNFIKELKKRMSS